MFEPEVSGVFYMDIIYEIRKPAIGHVKHDNRMIRCYLQGSIGDALHAMSCAAGYHIRCLMRAIMRLGLRGLVALVLLASWLTDRLRSRLRKARTANDTRSIPPIHLYCGLS